MTRDPEARTRKSSHDHGGSVKKRKRMSKHKQLLNILTGADDGEQGAPPAPSSVVEDRGDGPQAEEKQPAPEPTEAGGEAWMKPLSDAHAKKINITVLLERANLETTKQKNSRDSGSVLLNCDDHKHILHKTNRDANDARPDITHQCLLALLDSPLNKAGRLKVYIRTANNVLIEVHPQTRIPRTMRRFSGLMAELLEKFKVRGTTGSVPLLRVIRNPITSHLAVGTRKIVCTYNTENVVDIRHHAHEMSALALESEQLAKRPRPTEEDVAEHADEVNILYVVGAMAHGKVVEEWADDSICVSEYPLSAATVCSRITYAYESLLGIL